MRLQIPERLQHEVPRRAGDDGRAWIRTLPDRLDRVAERWNLDLGAPLTPGGIWSLVVQTSRGILKLGLRREESAFEGPALAAWAGHSAVQLYEFDPDENALLLEECRPGTSLSEVRDLQEADAIAASVLTNLWSRRPPTAIRRHDVSAKVAWLHSKRKTCPPDVVWLVDAAITELQDLDESTTSQALLHGDLHPENILRAEREPWLAIDPAPFVGDRAFDLVRWCQFRHGEIFLAQRYPDPSREWLRHIDRVSVLCGVDPGRVRRWMFGAYVEHALLAQSWNADSSPHLGAARLLSP